MTTFDCPLSFYGGNLAALRCKEPECVVAGPSDTGKTIAMLYKLHLMALKYPGAQLAIVRKVKSDMLGSCLHTFRRDILDPYAPYVTHYGGEYPQWYDYPTGSRIWIGGLDDPGKTLSSERDVVYFNQCEEGMLSDWEYLTRITTGRGAVMPYTQLVGDCNPAQPTHWILQRRDQGRLTFFESFHRDNPQLYDQKTGLITEEGERRIGRLEGLTGVRYKRLKQGLWAAPEGVIYDIYDEERHKVRAFDPPKTWPRVVGIDPLGAYVAAVWLAFDPRDKCLHAYREYYEPFGVTTRDHVQNILNLSRHETILAYVGGGPSERQARADWSGFGLPLVEPPHYDVWVGIDKIYSLMKEGQFKIHDCCVNLLSEIGDYRRKVNRKTGEFTDVIENKDMYHAADSARYGVAWLTGGEAPTRVVYEPVRIGAQY